jgi:hypothetical protein
MDAHGNEMIRGGGLNPPRATSRTSNTDFLSVTISRNPFIAAAALFLAALASASPQPVDPREHFADPPLIHAPRPLWFWNDTEVTKEGISEQMRKARDLSGYGGFGILPFGKGFGPEYLGGKYFEIYGHALDEARKLGMTMCLYDEFGFPSGGAGPKHGDGVPRFANQHPKHTIKRLDKQEHAITGPAEFSAPLPEGHLMSVVAMETRTKQRVDLTPLADNGRVTWQAPEGSWKIMIFVCVKDGEPIVDYLCPEAVSRFVEMTHQQYFDRFKEHFGTTIDGTFHDEPTMYRAKGRMWTDDFNRKFRAKHGFDPAPWYPALWHDIGPDTGAARNYLFGMRAELFATAFPKVIQDWSTQHGIAATGHQDQEEIVNQVGIAGDLMKVFQHMDIPGIDKIGGDRPAERVYKVVSSAAYNWDKALVMSETYGAMGDIPWQTIYQVALEQYTKGINQLIPHAVWYDTAKVTYKPELSWRNPVYAEGLPRFNKFLSRLNLMLQNDGRHVADIAVLYPIATLQGSHRFDGKLGSYKGGALIPEADYLDIGELLATGIGRDFTFLHPETLDARCRIDGDTLVMDNKMHPARFQVMIVPGHRSIRWRDLQKIHDYFAQGGRVIATGTLPSKSAEFGHDADVVGLTSAMFPGAGVIHRNDRGGMAVFLEKPDAGSLQAALDSMRGVYDVMFEGKPLRYIHKIHHGRHIYLFANLHPQPVNTRVRMRGHLEPELWNPHDGTISKVQSGRSQTGAGDITWLDLTLQPTSAVFLVSEADTQAPGTHNLPDP